MSRFLLWRRFSQLQQQKIYENTNYTVKTKNQDFGLRVHRRGKNGSNEQTLY